MFKYKHSHVKTSIFFSFFFWRGGQRQQGAFSDYFSDNSLFFSPIFGAQGCAETPRLAPKESALTGLIIMAALIACDLE